MSGGSDDAADRSPAFREALRNAARPSRRQLDRVSIVRTEDGLAIHNPAHRSVVMILFLIAWLGGWAAGANFALREMASGPLVVAIFLLIWLSIWTLAGLMVAFAVAWQWLGVERIFVLSGVLAVERTIGPWKRSRLFPLVDVDGPRERGRAVGHAGLLSVGTIAFTAAGKEISVGYDLSEVERAAVMEALRQEMARPGARLLKPKFGRA